MQKSAGSNFVKFRLTAPKAQARIRDIAKVSSDVILTDHAIERMHQRGIVASEVFRILRTGYVDDPPEEVRDGEWKCKITQNIGERESCWCNHDHSSQRQIGGDDGRVGGREMKRKEWRMEGEADCEPLHYTACGLDDVYLLSGWKREDTAYGSGISIKDVDGLHEAIGLYLVSQKKALSGNEVRFLRKEMNLTQEELGERIQLSGQQIARWEKEKSDIPGSGELLLRLLYLQHVGVNGLITELVKKLRTLDERGGTKQFFKATRKGWEPEPKAA